MYLAIVHNTLGMSSETNSLLDLDCSCDLEELFEELNDLKSKTKIMLCITELKLCNKQRLAQGKKSNNKTKKER